MDIAVFSDSHGNSVRMKEVIHGTGVDAVIFLGDGLSDIESIMMTDRRRRIYISVRGNCDRMADDTPAMREFELCGVKFLALHGNAFNVKYGTERLEAYARSKGVDIVLYGHTHTPDNRYLPETEDDKPLYIFNPGSIGASYKPTFGTIAVDGGKLLTNIAEYREGAL